MTWGHDKNKMDGELDDGRVWGRAGLGLFFDCLREFFNFDKPEEEGWFGFLLGKLCLLVLLVVALLMLGLAYRSLM